MAWRSKKVKVDPKDVFQRIQNTYEEFSEELARRNPETNDSGIFSSSFNSDSLTDSFFSEYRRGECLGSGGFAEVYLYNKKEGARDTRDRPRQIAVKLMKRTISEGHRKSLEDEMGILKKCEHQNIVRYLHYNMMETGHNELILRICMEYCDTSLDKILVPMFKEEQRLSMEPLKALSRQVLMGLCYLHDNDVAHRDLKPANILIQYSKDRGKSLNEAQAKIADLGLAINLTQGDCKTIWPCGTEGFLAPEVERVWRNQKNLHRGFPKSADIFSFGLTLWYMATSKKFEKYQLTNIEEGKLDSFLQGEIDADVSNDDVKEALKAMLKNDPEARKKTSSLKDDFSLFKLV